MKAINVDDFIFDLDRIKAIVSSDSRTASLIEKLQYMIIEYERRHPIDAEPVRHGRWIERKSIHADGGVVAKCSICEKDVQYLGQRLKFCPNCGTKMDLKE